MLATFAVAAAAAEARVAADARVAVGGRPLTRDQPPPAFTGGFGEGTCHECHFEAEINGGAGRLRLEGVPERYEPGREYAITVMLVHPGVRAAGFQLAVRFQGDGAQAGRLAAPPASTERVTVTEHGGISYAHHLRAGTLPGAADTARWQLLWTAPPGGGAVVVHAVGNAANDDDSPLGDHIYTAVSTSQR